MASIRARTASRGSSRPASIIPSIAASIAAAFIFMKSVSVLSRSRTMARIKTLLAREPDAAAEADLAVVDAKVEPAGRIAAHPGLVGDRRAVATVVRERQQNAVVALPALRKRDVHPSPLPSPGAPKLRLAADILARAIRRPPAEGIASGSGRRSLRFHESAPRGQEAQRGANPVFDRGSRGQGLAVRGRFARFLQSAAEVPEPGDDAAVRVLLDLGLRLLRGALGLGAGVFLRAFGFGTRPPFLRSRLALLSGGPSRLALHLHEAGPEDALGLVLIVRPAAQPR